MNKPRTTRVTPIAFATEGGVRQEGSLPIYRCNCCNRQVVWATSSRTGRRYLVDVQRGRSGQRFYVKAVAHTCPPPLPEESNPAHIPGPARWEALKAEIAAIKAEALAAKAAAASEQGA